MNHLIDVKIEESEIFTLLDLKGTICPVEDETILTKTQAENQKYQELCASKEGNDRYTERSMQTLENAAKSRHVQCDAVIYESIGVEASIADIYDENEKLKSGEKNTDSGEVKIDNIDSALEDLIDDETKKEAGATTLSENGNNQVDPFASTQSSVALLSTIQGSFVQFDHPKASNQQKTIVQERLQDLQLQNVLKATSFSNSLTTIERMLSLNDNQDNLAKYRNIRQKMMTTEQLAEQMKNDKEMKKEKEKNGKKKAYLEDSVGAKKLFSYLCPKFLVDESVPRTVTAIKLNKKNPDLIAVGYGYYTQAGGEDVSIYDTKSKHKAGVVWKRVKIRRYFTFLDDFSFFFRFLQHFFGFLQHFMSYIYSTITTYKSRAIKIVTIDPVK